MPIYGKMGNRAFFTSVGGGGGGRRGGRENTNKTTFSGEKRRLPSVGKRWTIPRGTKKGRADDPKIVSNTQGESFKPDGGGKGGEGALAVSGENIRNGWGGTGKERELVKINRKPAGS